MANSFPFHRLVRFENKSGEVKYGEVASENLDSLVGSTVEVYNGDLPWDSAFHKSGKKDVIHKVGHNDCCTKLFTEFQISQGCGTFATSADLRGRRTQL